MRFSALLGAVLLGGLALLAVAAPILAPYDPSLATGAPLQAPGAGHVLGTNDIGQDVWSQWLWAGRASLLVALAVTAVSTGLAWGVGILAVVWTRASGVLLAATDLLLALPSIPLLLLVVALVGPSQVHLVVALGVLSWPAFARVVRARLLVVMTEPYVAAARAAGGTSTHIALRHLAPATLELLPAKLALTVRFAMFAEATLAFLGLGDPTARSWGTMLGWAFNDPLIFASGAWTWWVVPPALAIVVAVLGVTWLVPGPAPVMRRADDSGRRELAAQRQPRGVVAAHPVYAATRWS